MNKSDYKNSKKRLTLLLVQLSILVYTLVRGNEEAQILAALLLPMMIMSLMTWRNE